MTKVPAPNDDLPLFRAEATQAASSKMGAPVPATGLSSWAVALFLVTVVAGALAYLSAQRYSRKETVTGVLEPSAGALRVTSLRAGVISAIYVHEGEDVRAGAPIIAVDLDTMVEGGSQLGELLKRASRDQLQADLDQTNSRLALLDQQGSANAAKLTGLRADLTALETADALQSERISLQEKSLESAEKLRKIGLFSELGYRQRQEAVVDARQSQVQLKREHSDVVAQIAETQAIARQLSSQADELRAQQRAATAAMDEKKANLAAQRQLVLTAPRDGRVVALNATTGQPVTTATALAVILPKGASLEAQLWAPSRAIGFVKAGEEVRLMYDAFPFEQFGVARGRVMAVARAPTAANELPFSAPEGPPQPLYKVTVRLDRQTVRAYGREWPLSPGGRLTADLVLESRPMLHWLLEPVLAVSKRGL